MASSQGWGRLRRNSVAAATQPNTSTHSGVYNVPLDTTDMGANIIVVGGTSTTPGVVVRPLTIITEQGHMAVIEGYTDDIGIAGAGLTALGDTRLANLNPPVGSIPTNPYTGTPPTADAIGTDAASKVLVSPAWKIVTDSSGRVTPNAVTPAAPSTADIKTAMEVDGGMLDHLHEMTQDNGSGTRQMTADALELGPSGSGLDAAGVRTAIGMATANMDTQLSGLSSSLSTLLGRITSTLFSGITYLKNWLALGMGKGSDPTTLAEVNATLAGVTFSNATDALEALKDLGLTVTVSLTQAAIAALSVTTNTLITRRRGDRWTISLTGLGSISTRTKLYMTVKETVTMLMLMQFGKLRKQRVF